jgi:hypothetical protein
LKKVHSSSILQSISLNSFHVGFVERIGVALKTGRGCHHNQALQATIRRTITKMMMRKMDFTS